jgi:hypothetical protein
MRRDPALRIAEHFVDRERRSAPAQKLHNNPEILPEANAESASATLITSHRRPTNASQKQMKSISIAAFPAPVLCRGVPAKLAVAAGATAFADWLFYDHKIGLSLAVFLPVLAGLSLLTNRVRTSRREVLIAAAILIAGLAPIVEELNILSALFGVGAAAIAVSSLTNPFIGDLRDHFKAAGILLLAGPFRLFPDIAKSRTWSLSLRYFTVWIVPLVLSAIFLVLFASANPLIAKLLAALDPRNGASQLSVARLLFWIAIVSVIWPFIGCSAIWIGSLRILPRRLSRSSTAHIREVICVTLKKAGMVPLEARDGAEALSRFAAPPSRPHRA